MGKRKDSIEQGELIERFMAQDFADEFIDSLEEGESPLPALVKLISDMEGNEHCKKHDSYMFIHIIGFGEVKSCFVWWLTDDSAMIVGVAPDEPVSTEDAGSLIVGVLPPGCTFKPMPFTEKGIPTIH